MTAQENTMTARRIGIFYMGRSNNGGTQVRLPNGGSVWIRVEEAPVGATLVSAMDGVSCNRRTRR